MAYITNVEELVDELKGKLPEYLQMMLGGEAGNVGKKLHCFAHEDSNPSMSYNPHSGYTSVMCWSGCGSFDIFRACNVLEGMPDKGPEWITSTLPHLAEKLGLEVQLGEVSEHERNRANLFRLNNDITNILKETTLNDEYIESRGWKSDHIVIGSIDATELEAKLQELGYPLKFIREYGVIGTGAWSYFGEDRVTFAIKDYRGRTVGFVARYIPYQKGGAIPKYINSSESIVYRKREILLGLDAALKYAKKDGLYLVEGPGDVASMHAQEIHNVAAVCGVSFTGEHLALLKMLGVTKLFLCLDWDDAGQKASLKIMKEELRFAPGVTCFVVNPPEEGFTGDPGEYLESSGADKFRELTMTPGFEWTLKFAGEDQPKDQVCEELVPLIASEQSAVRREILIKTLSDFTGIMFQSIAQDVEALRDGKAAQRRERIEAAVQKFSRAGVSDPDNVLALVGTFEKDLEKIEKEFKRNIIGVSYQMDRYEAALQLKASVDTDANMAEFVFGHHRDFGDAMSGGMNATRGVLGYIGGRANSGKTATVISLATDVALHDNNAIVITHFTDDSYTQVEPRFIGNIAAMIQQHGDADLEIGMAANPYVNIKNDAQWEVYNRATEVLRNLLKEERLIVIDSEDGATLTALERNLRYVRQRYPNKKLLVVCDKCIVTFLGGPRMKKPVNCWKPLKPHKLQYSLARV